MKRKIKTGTVWALFAALLLLSAKVEASTVFFVSNPAITTDQIFFIDLIFNILSNQWPVQLRPRGRHNQDLTRAYILAKSRMTTDGI